MQIRRRHNAITYAIEKRLLDIGAKRIYPHFTADQLSLLALLGAVIAGTGYILAANNLSFLHLSNLGIFIQWFGDSLDGRVARLRGEFRPKLGYYLDHILDAISSTIVIFSLGFSRLTVHSLWLWVLIFYLLHMIHSFLKATVTGVFELTFERFGPTEIRIAIILINLLVVVSGNPSITLLPLPVNLFDTAGAVLVVFLFISFVKAVFSSLWGRYRIKDK